MLSIEYILSKLLDNENMDNRILLAPGANNNVSEQDVEKFIDGKERVG